MPDFLDTLAIDAKRTIKEGYYEVELKNFPAPIGLTDSILNCNKAPVIPEIKFASPTSGIIRNSVGIGEISREMERGEAVAISVLTEPKNFKGSLGILAEVRSNVKIPILMKDIILSPRQIDAAHDLGVDAVLLIMALFNREYCECSLHEMIRHAHSKGVEVLLETHGEEEFKSAITTQADLIGINNRDLRTLEVSLETTRRVLGKICARDRIVVSESGIKTPEDIRFLKECGARAFLVGTTIMRASNIEETIKKLVNAV